MLHYILYILDINPNTGKHNIKDMSPRVAEPKDNFFLYCDNTTYNNYKVIAEHMISNSREYITDIPIVTDEKYVNFKIKLLKRKLTDYKFTRTEYSYLTEVLNIILVTSDNSLMLGIGAKRALANYFTETNKLKKDQYLYVINLDDNIASIQNLKECPF